MRRHAEEAFSYGDYCGYYPLRDTLSRILSAQGIATRPEQLLITNGSQHAISLVSQSLLAPGDTVLVEEPTYAEAIALFRLHKVNVVALPSDQQGMQLDTLPALLVKHQPKLIYCIPNFNNPTGRCLSESRRHQLLHIARAAGVPILEDDYVGDLRYSGKNCLHCVHWRHRARLFMSAPFPKCCCPACVLVIWLPTNPTTRSWRV